MERAVKVLQQNKLSKKFATDDEFSRALWPSAVGKAIAAHTSRIRLVRTTLVVEVEDAIWQRQLHALSRQILDRLQRLGGGLMIQDLEFRVGVPRREPQRAAEIGPSVGRSLCSQDDDAESIPDPILKRLYRMSRKRATA